MNPSVYVARLEPVPMPGCVACRAASEARAEAHMRGRPDQVREATEIIRAHPNHSPEAQG